MANHPNIRGARKNQLRTKQKIAPPKLIEREEAHPEPEGLPVISPRAALITLAVFLSVGFLFRVLHLSDLSLWMDEYVHVMRAKNFLEGDGPLFTDDNNGILLTLLLLPGFAVFGPEVFWARFPSVLFGIGAIWLVYRMGTRLFNRYVGLFAAAGATFSLYLIFWSRVSRNYAIFCFFFLLLGMVFLKATETRPDRKLADWWSRQGLSGRHVALLPAVGLLSLLSHQLTFFFVFTVLFFSLIKAVVVLQSRAEKRELWKYIWLSGILLPFALVFLIPALGEALKNVLQPFLLSNIADWAIPDWNRLAAWWAEKPLESFYTYNDLLLYDLNWLYLPALLGLVAAYRLNLRAGIWLTASFVVPFLLLCFIFREPFLRRYLIFAYPYLLISAGVFFYTLLDWVKKQLWPVAGRQVGYALMSAPFVLVLFNARWNGIADLALARKLEGHIVDMRIANWSFTNWREACDYVNRFRQPGDMLMSTVPTAVSYYMEHENVLWFRQAYYDTREKRYKLHPPNPGGGPSAASFEDLVRTVQQTPRGWLLADYYLENVFTDERALLWVYQNMHYYPDASMDGSLMVFGWDHSRPKPERQNLVVELGCDDDKMESKEYHMTLPKELFSHAQLEMTVRTRWVDSDQEALILFNGKHVAWLPPNRSAGIDEATVPIDRSWIHPGQNTVQVFYEPNRPTDPRKGFTLYYMSIAGK
ncbi:MAG: glycosyltransferase family 39 protein [Thermoanaerobaculia bacterium]|nr:glycosyltransferase family 39 protein [Thermoanaerobaculia bacterium]